MTVGDSLTPLDAMQLFASGVHASDACMWLALSAALFLGGAVLSLAFSKSKFCRHAGFLSALAGSILALAAGVAGLVFPQESSLVLGFVPGLGSLSLGVDALSGFFLCIIGLCGAAVSLYSVSYAEEYERKGYGAARFGFLFNIFLLSMSFVVAAQNAVVFLIFWEMMALSSFFLVTFETTEQKANGAGSMYLIITHLGTACLLVMYLVLAGANGGTPSFDFSSFAATHYAAPVLDVIFILALVGFGAKAGIMPLHVWLPLAHPNAPSNVSALMSGVMLKTAVYGLVRVLFGFLGAPASEPFWWGLLLLGAGSLTALFGALYSLMETDIKRVLAMSSIENIGIIFLALGAALLLGWADYPALAGLALLAALFHSLNHAFFKTLLFLGAGSVAHAAHSRELDALGGLIKRMPFTAIVFLVGAAAIAGVPPLNGFAGEWLIFQALFSGLQSDVYLAFSAAAILLALTSALSAASAARLFGIVFLGAPRSDAAAHAKEVPRLMLVGGGILAAACIVAGALPGAFASFSIPVLNSLGVENTGTAVRVASSLPNAEILLALSAVALFAFALTSIVRVFSHSRETMDVTWDCGVYAPNPRAQYSGIGLAQPISRMFDSWINPLKKTEAYGQRLFDYALYQPAVRIFLRVSPLSRALQTGKLGDYVYYLMATLVLVILYAIY